MTTPPKVFLSHASADKDRFVWKFAEALRARGVDVWLDAWEINAGDNPVRKIFDEGLKECEAVVLVMSAVSVTKPWVQAELDHAFVKRIEGRAKLIPLRLDNCTMPECLLTTRWESIPDCSSYDDVFDRVLNAIFGHHPRPAVGSPPAYAESPTIQLAQLDQIDSLVFQRMCEVTIRQGHRLINEDQWSGSLEELGLSRGRLVDTQEMLEEQGYIELHRTIAPPGTLHSATITLTGFQEYANTCLPDFDHLISQVAATLARDNGTFPSGNSLADDFGQPLRVIEHILELLENSGLIHIQRQLGGSYMTVSRVSTTLKRMADAGL